MQTVATRNLRTRLKGTLTSQEPSEFPVKLNGTLKTRLPPFDNSIEIATLPPKLQHLCVLALQLEAEFSAEVHRQCVEILGAEEYDNAGIEFSVYCNVQEDSDFNQAPKIWKILKRRVYRHYRSQLITPEGYEVIFYIDHQFRVFKTPHRKLTVEEKKLQSKQAVAEAKKRNELRFGPAIHL